MNRIKAIYFSYLTAEIHGSFLVGFRELLDASPEIKSLIVELYPSFVERLDREIELIRVMKMSEYTKYIAEADKRIDRCFTGINKVVSAALHHFNPLMIDAARSIDAFCRSHGDARRKSYMGTLLTANMIIEKLRSPQYAEKAELIGLTPWVAELADASAVFDVLIQERMTESANKPKGRLRDVRKDTEAVYSKIIDYINAAAIVGSNPAVFDDFINRVNTNIGYTHEQHYRGARKDIGAAGALTVEMIPPQPFTGNPVTVVPSVNYRHATADGDTLTPLFLGQDFTVAFRNNTSPGTAAIIISGKGKYSGKKIVTFTIK